MCTVSAHINGETTIVTMNRDEARNRPESPHIKKVIQGKLHWYYPVDQRSGGTWFGFNNQGTTFALLNRYHEQQHNQHQLQTTSRGIIIPSMLATMAKSQDYTVHDKLAVMLQTQYFNPFDLLMIDQSALTNFCWNGKKLITKSFDRPQTLMFSSSSVDTNQILKKRALYFDQFRQGLKSVNDQPNHFLNGLHRQQETHDLSSSIMMSRPQTHTKSISQIVIDHHEKQLTYYYFDEDQLHRHNNPLTYTQCQQQRSELLS